eukprot:3685221-Alexandrium_andersonii.AAC.1
MPCNSPSVRGQMESLLWLPAVDRTYRRMRRAGVDFDVSARGNVEFLNSPKPQAARHLSALSPR